MIRLLIVMFILAFVASKLYGLPDEPATTTAPSTPTTKPAGASTPIPTPPPKPTGVHLVSQNAGAPAPLPPPSPPASNAPNKIASGIGTALSGIGEGFHDLTTVMVDDGDETSRATCGLLGIVWTVLGLVGIAVLRLISRILGGLLG